MSRWSDPDRHPVRYIASSIAAILALNAGAAAVLYAFGRLVFAVFGDTP